jgi:uncharacterized membrane protein
MRQVKIRYNTNVGDSGLYWRIIINGVEHLASDIDINVPTKTTGDFIHEVGLKHHITCEPDNIKWEGTKVILTNNKKYVSKLRHISKSITWRLLGTVDTILLSWIISGNFKIGLSIGGFEIITKMILYYLHERAWYKFGFGVETKNN